MVKTYDKTGMYHMQVTETKVKTKHKYLKVKEVLKHMGYYNDKQKAFEALDKALTASMNSGKAIHLNALFYEFGKLYAVSQKSLEQQFKRFAEINGFKEITPGVFKR